MTLLSIYIHIEGSNHCVGKLKKYSKWKIHIVNGYTNAEAAYVAAQALATEAYGKGVSKGQITHTGYVTKTKVAALTDIQTDSSKWSFTFTVKDSTASTGHDAYIIDTFTYREDGNYAVWTREANKTITFGDSSDSFTSTAGGWVVGSGTPTIAD